jgi:hypothetical protein
MPQFYFEVTTGAGIASEGYAVDLPSLETARAEAMMMAAEMAKEGGAAPKDIAIAIRDETRETVGTVRLTLAYDERAP